MRFKKSFVILTILTVLTFFLLIGIIKTGHRNNKHQTDESKCGTIHIGIVCLGYGNINFYTMLKSLYFFRNSPLHFHIIVDNAAEMSIKTLFDTWAVPQVRLNFYNVNDSIYNWQWLLENQNPGLLKLAFPTIIPVKLTNKIIVVDSDIIFAANIQELWYLFDNFKGEDFIGLPEIISPINTTAEDRFSSNIILYHLEHLQIIDWQKLWMEAVDEYTSLLKGGKLSDQVIVNEVVNNKLNSVYQLPCQWNSQTATNTCNDHNRMKFVYSLQHLLPAVDGKHSNETQSTFMEYDGYLLRWQLDGCIERLNNTVPLRSVPKECISFPEAQTYIRRTLLYFREFKYTPTTYDVTFVTQLSYDKLQILDEIGQRWQGPMSISFYVTDSELQECIKYIEKSTVLQNRLNIGFHAIFKDGSTHPINALRNIALKQVVTPYVFLNDIDLVPMQNMYFTIQEYIHNEKNMEKKALVVPAFETDTKIPTSKTDLLKMMGSKLISIVRHRQRPEGHGPTNYKKWISAYAPYQVKWKPKYEPYVVVHRNITKYDERFFAYGWDKISHIMEVEAQGYIFLVLPNAFVVHKNHPRSKDKRQFINSAKYKSCLKSLKQNSIKDLNSKYGRTFDVY